MTCVATLRALFQGQTRRIMELAVNVRNLRAFLMVREFFFACDVSNLVIQTMSQQEKERKAEELRRTQANLAPVVDHPHESNMSDAATLTFIDVHG